MPLASGKLKTLLKDSLVYGLTLSLSKFAIILLIPIYTRFLTVGKYGAFDTILLFGTLLTILFLFGQDDALGRFYYDTVEERRKHLLGTVFSNILFVSFSITAVLFVLAKPISTLILNTGEYVYEFRLILIYAFFTAVLNFFRSVARWEFNKKRYFFLTITPALSILLATFIALGVMDTGIRGAIYSQIFTNAAFSLISFFLFPFSLPKKNFFIPLLKYGTPIMIAVSLASLTSVLDKAFYIRLFGEDTLGYYSMGGRYALFIALPQTAFWVAWSPLIFSTYKDKDVMQTANNVLLLFSAIFSLALVLQFALSEIIITAISGSAYLEGIKFALPLSFIIVLEGSANVSAIGIDIEKKTYLNALFNAVGTIAMITLIIPMTSFFNALGIAYALLLGKIFSIALRVITSAKVSSLRFKLLVPYGVLSLSFILSFISVNLNTAPVVLILFRLASVLLLTAWLAAVLLKLIK